MKAIKKLQGRVDEMILQMDLGKMEAIDKVEQSKEKLHNITNSIIESRDSVSNPVKQKVGELQVQLKLGKMETRDAYYDQLEGLKSAIKNAKIEIRDAEHKAADEFCDASDRLLDRISILGFQVEIAEKRVADEIRSGMKKTKSSLIELKERILECMEATDQKSHETADDCHTAYTDIVSNLKTLLKK